MATLPWHGLVGPKYPFLHVFFYIWYIPQFSVQYYIIPRAWGSGSGIGKWVPPRDTQELDLARI